MLESRWRAVIWLLGAQAQRTHALRRGVLWPLGAVCTASCDVVRVAGSSWCGIAWLCLMSGLQRGVGANRVCPGAVACPVCIACRASGA